MTKTTRPISWIKAARKDFDDFPVPVQKDALRALTVAAEGHRGDHVTPLKGFGGGVMEILSCASGETLSASFMPSS